MSTQGGDATNDLLGIWAHSEKDCQTKLSGKLDRGDLSRPQQTPYEFIGFCRHGMELLYQPVYCETQQVTNSGGGYRWSGKCEVKGDPYQSLTLRIRGAGPNAISFDQKQFEQQQQNFWITGKYVRCSLTYDCSNAPTQGEENSEGNCGQVSSDAREITGIAPPESGECFDLQTIVGKKITLRVASGNNIIFTITDVADAQNEYTWVADRSVYHIYIAQLMRSLTAENYKVSIEAGD